MTFETSDKNRFCNYEKPRKLCQKQLNIRKTEFSKFLTILHSQYQISKYCLDTEFVKVNSVKIYCHKNTSL